MPRHYCCNLRLLRAGEVRDGRADDGRPICAPFLWALVLFVRQRVVVDLSRVSADPVRKPDAEFAERPDHKQQPPDWHTQNAQQLSTQLCEHPIRYHSPFHVTSIIFYFVPSVKEDRP